MMPAHHPLTTSPCVECPEARAGAPFVLLTFAAAAIWAISLRRFLLSACARAKPPFRDRSFQRFLPS
jgi:hypothetical protein